MTFRSSASTTSRSRGTSIPLLPPCACRPSSSARLPDGPSSTGSTTDRYRSGRCCRPSSSSGRRHATPPRRGTRPTGTTRSLEEAGVGPRRPRPEEGARRDRRRRERSDTACTSASDRQRRMIALLGGSGDRPGGVLHRATLELRALRLPTSAAHRARRRRPRPLASRRPRRRRPARRLGLGHRDLDRRRAGVVHGDGQALGGPDRRQGPLHRHARHQRDPLDRHRSPACCPTSPACPAPARCAEYVQAGALKPLNDVIDMTAYTADTAPGLVDARHGERQALRRSSSRPTSRDCSGTTPASTRRARPSTYDDLLAKGKQTADGIGGDAKTFCVGLESGAASGWPGSDWVEQFVLNQSGPDVYDKWVAGQQKWTSPEIKQAFEAFGNVIANTFGGGKNANATNFVASGDKLFSNPPGCVFVNHGDVHHRRVQEDRWGDGRPVRLHPLPDDQPGLRGGGRGRGRPVRHVQRHAAGQVAHRLPHHAGSPVDLGRSRRRAVGQQAGHRTTRTTS